MKKFILSLIFLCVFSKAHAGYSMGVPASDSNLFYGELFGGANFLQSETDANYKVGYTVSGSLGYLFCYGFRFEGEYAYRHNNLKKVDGVESAGGHFQSSSYMANLLWDLPLENCGINFCALKPFIGAGIGYDHQEIHSSADQSCREENKGFSWQAIAGLAYPISPYADLSFTYKFHQGRFCDLYNHSIGLGLSYRFKIGSSF